MSVFGVFSQRLTMRLKKYPELALIWSGQTGIIRNKKTPVGTIGVSPGPRLCTVLVKVGAAEGATPMEWLELETALRALSGEANA